MNKVLKIALASAGLTIATQAAAEVTFFEGEGFQGRSFSTRDQVGDFQRFGFNDRASSVVVTSDRWEICDDARFSGRCVVLRPGRYPSLAAMGMNDRVSSVRMVSGDAQIQNDRYAPAPVMAPDSRDGAVMAPDYHRRHNERLYEANVTSVHAVVGPPEQRCWVDREQVTRDTSRPNVPGAIAGAIVGGILGHQVGGGRGQDVATAGGAVEGAAIGSSVGRDRGGPDNYDQDVRHCETMSQGQPDYWDVTYNFRGVEHRMQMTAPPGPTVTVSEQGEPRG